MNPLLNQEQVRLSALAAQIGQELTSLADEIDQLQGMLSKVLCAAAPDPDLMVQAQALDRAFQHISQLGGVLDRIAVYADPEWRLALPNLLNPVSLTALAERLAGHASLIEADDELELL